MVAQANLAEAKERSRELVTHGYWHLMAAPKGADAEMPTLYEWLIQWGVGDEDAEPAEDPREMFARVYGPYLEKEKGGKPWPSAAAPPS